MDSPIFSRVVGPVTAIIDSTRTDPRGQMSAHQITLASSIASPTETLCVFTHESGHVVDIYRLVGTTFTEDPSSQFYRISWTSTYNIKKTDAIADFVSGYALTNQYEDFAETFAMYVLHNDEFKARAAKDVPLQAKYDFMHSVVFRDDSFVGTSFSLDPVPNYLWDTTKLTINLQKYLYYIR